LTQATLAPAAGPRRGDYLSNQAVACFTDFRVIQEEDYLDQMLHACQAAVDESPDEVAARPADRFAELRILLNAPPEGSRS
jgi:hypothetical protein